MAIAGMMWVSRPHHFHLLMQTIAHSRFMQRWTAVQHELIPDLAAQFGALTPKLEKLVHVLDWVRIEDFTPDWHGVGRPPHQRGWLANAFVAKAVLGLTTTVGLIDRLQCDRSLRRICGFAMHRRLPSEATFSRSFEEFAVSRLAERVHEALVKEHLGDELIGHLSRDGTAIVARERPAKRAKPRPPERTAALKGMTASEVAKPVAGSSIKRQLTQSLDVMLAEIPTACTRGTKCNAQGYKISWNGYKLHLDTADCGVPISALLSSASMHDSQAAVPLSLISAQRVTNLYDLMDAAYCSLDLHEHCRTLNHVPVIDHNRRGGEKVEFDAADAVRYRERTVAERTNARLKDEFGANHVRVRGGVKVMGHLMFGVLVLAADQMMRLLQ